MLTRVVALTLSLSALIACGTTRADRPPTPAAQPGDAFITVDSVPGARVFIDGAVAGTVPIKRWPVAPGWRELRVELSGHHPVVRSFRVQRREHTRFTVALRATRNPRDSAGAAAVVGGFCSLPPVPLPLRLF